METPRDPQEEAPRNPRTLLRGRVPDLRRGQQHGVGVEAIYADENLWVSQKRMAQLYDVDVRTINYHLTTIFADSELEEDTVVRTFRITAAHGKTHETKHYNLSAIIGVGYKVNSQHAVQFRKWATRIVDEFTIKGFAMDDERIKSGGRMKPASGTARARASCRLEALGTRA